MRRINTMAVSRGLFAALLATLLAARAAAAQPSCPQWGSANQGITSDTRPDPGPGVFTELSADELTQVTAFLARALKTEPVAYDARSLYRNFVHGAWLEVPPKDEVLAYLDRGGPKPVRKARAVVVMGAANPPYVQDVLVWPVPNPARWAPALINRTAKALPFHMRPHSGADIPGQVYLLAKLTATLKTFFSEALDAAYGDGCEPRCMYDNYANVGYLSPEVPRALWLWFVRPAAMTGDGNFLHPVPLQVAIAQNGQDIENWRVIQVWYAGYFFNSAEDLAAEWAKKGNGRLSGLKMKYATGSEALYSNFRRRPGNVRAANQPLGPLQFEPYGRRFSITGNKVAWLGWEFYVGNKASAGPRLWDIRFKGDRIVYELSAQEFMAAYGGDDIVQSHTVFLDSHWGVGASVRELVHGVDCPLTAAYMDATTLYKSLPTPVVHKNAICVFESDQNVPGLRHYDYAFQYYGAIKSHMLTVRMVSEVYNYDYVVDFNFYIDGTLQPTVSTSGYIQAAGGALPAWRNKFAYPLMWNVSGSLHNHVVAWKVDLDVAGRSNSVNMHQIGVQKSETPGMGMPIWSYKYEAKLAEREGDTAVNYGNGAPSYPVIVSERARNRWGSYRGYKFQPLRPTMNLIPENEGWGGGLGFANWAFVATVRHENEPDSSSIYSQPDLSRAPVRLQTFVDGEYARNQDLVAWVSQGLYHIPISEDAPVTPTFYNHIGFMLVPFNYHDENAATDMADMFQIDDSNQVVPPVQSYVQGAQYQCKPQFENVPFSRKWDPN